MGVFSVSAPIRPRMNTFDEFPDLLNHLMKRPHADIHDFMDELSVDRNTPCFTISAPHQISGSCVNTDGSANRAARLGEIFEQSDDRSSFFFGEYIPDRAFAVQPKRLRFIT